MNTDMNTDTNTIITIMTIIAFLLGVFICLIFDNFIIENNYKQGQIDAQTHEIVYHLTLNDDQEMVWTFKE